MSLLQTALISVALTAVVPATLALGLIVSARPIADLRAEGQGLNFGVLQASDVAAPLRQHRRPDGTMQGFRRWDSGVTGAPLVVAVHGSGWHGGQFQGLGAALAGQGIDVIAPDLRGHGPDPVWRGDVDYIGQFEDDLADLIRAQAAPGQRVILLGHSSGGGLVIRFAGGAHRAVIDRAVLLAPFVQHDAPTQRANSGGWARVLTRRLIGLSMLNAVGITALNHLTVIQFRFPDSVLEGPQGHTATRAYSYRLNTGFAPRRDWRGDIAALPPFLLMAGHHDEAFVAEAFEPAFAPLNPTGQYRLIDSAHLDLVDHPQTLAAVALFARAP